MKKRIWCGTPTWIYALYALRVCGYVGCTIPWMESVESSQEQRPRKRLVQVFETRLDNSTSLAP